MTLSFDAWKYAPAIHICCLKVVKLFGAVSLSSLLTSFLTYRVFMFLVGDIFEHAVVLSVKMEDQDAFERHFLQLKSYYTDTR
jgi:26S proteasome regulatory subunit N12